MNTTLVELDDKSCLVADEKGNFSIAYSDSPGQAIGMLQFENDLESLKNQYKKLDTDFRKKIDILTLKMIIFMILFTLPIFLNSASVWSVIVSTLFSVATNKCINMCTCSKKLNIKQMITDYKKIDELENKISEFEEKLEEFKIKRNYTKTQIQTSQNTEEKTMASEIVDYTSFPDNGYDYISTKPKVIQLKKRNYR